MRKDAYIFAELLFRLPSLLTTIQQTELCHPPSSAQRKAWTLRNPKLCRIACEPGRLIVSRSSPTSCARYVDSRTRILCGSCRHSDFGSKLGVGFAGRRPVRKLLYKHQPTRTHQAKKLLYKHQP